MIAAGDGLAGRAGRRDQAGVEGDRLDAPDRLPLDGAVLGLGRLGGERPRLGQQCRQRVRVEVPLVEQQGRLAGDRRDHARLRGRAARGRHPAVTDCGVAHREGEARGREERVAPVGHRRRAGVRGLSAEDHAVALHADRAEHRPDGEAEPLEHGPLLDVQLEVGAYVLQAASRLPRAIELDAVRGERILEPHPVRVAQVAHRVRIERARDGGGAEQAAAEARALLVRPVHERHRAGRRARLSERAQGLQGAHDAERAVEPAAVGHGVDVGADHDGLGPLAREARPEIAGLVHVDLDGQLRERLSQQSARVLPLVRPGQAARTAGAAGQLRQRSQIGDRTLRLTRDLHLPSARAPG